MTPQPEPPQPESPQPGSPTALGPGAPATRARGVAFAWTAAALALLAVGLWLRAHPPAPTVDLGMAPLARLDTVALSGRIVTAVLDGTVCAVGAEGQVWVGTADHAFEVRGAARDSLGVEDRVLVAGRIREGDGRRWLDAHTVTHVVGLGLGAGRRSGERPTVQPED